MALFGGGVGLLEAAAAEVPHLFPGETPGGGRGGAEYEYLHLLETPRRQP